MPNGKIPDALANGPWVTPLKPEPGKEGERSTGKVPAEKARSLDTVSLSAEATRMYRAGEATAITGFDTLHKNTQSDELEGKTVVRNLWSGLIVGSTLGPDGHTVVTAYDANKSAANGGATHGFLYEDASFLLDAATKYSSLGENEVFYLRDIHDEGFVRNTLDFFTGGNYTDSDVSAVQEQISDLVYELAQQLKNGETPDFNKLQGTLTIGGADVTVSQLLDFQKVGRQLEGAFNNISVGQMNVQTYAEMGIAKSIGAYYGSDKGQIGELFSAGIEALYKKAVDNVQRDFSRSTAAGITTWTERSKDSVKTGLQIADLFSRLDTSSKEQLSDDLTSNLAVMRELVQEHCARFGVSPSDLGLAGDTAGIIKFFKDLANQV